MASKIAAPPRAPAAPRRRVAAAEPTEARRSSRARGERAPGFTDDAYDDDYSGDDDAEEGVQRRAWRAGRRAHIPQARRPARTRKATQRPDPGPGLNRTRKAAPRPAPPSPG